MKQLSLQAHEHLNDEALIAERDQWFDRMSDLFNGKDNEYLRHKVFTLHGMELKHRSNMYSDPEAWFFECLELALTKKAAFADGFSPICVECRPYGVHYIDKMLGANVYNYAGQWNAD